MFATCTTETWLSSWDSGIREVSSLFNSFERNSFHDERTLHFPARLFPARLDLATESPKCIRVERGERNRWKTGALNSISNRIPLNAFVNNAFSDSSSNAPSEPEFTVFRVSPSTLKLPWEWRNSCRELREGETSITSDETRGNKRLSPPRTRIILLARASQLYSLPLSITLVLF